MTEDAGEGLTALRRKTARGSTSFDCAKVFVRALFGASFNAKNRYPLFRTMLWVLFEHRIIPKPVPTFGSDALESPLDANAAFKQILARLKRRQSGAVERRIGREPRRHRDAEALVNEFAADIQTENR
jgi:hypothetical protein